MKHTTIREAMDKVSKSPVLATDELIQVPVHELVVRSLFDIANTPDASTRGSMARANRARKLIFDRMVGKRRAGSHPATRTEVQLEFVDLTGEELES